MNFKDKPHWIGAVTLREHLYTLYKQGRYNDDEFQLYIRLFGRDTVRAWVVEERDKERKKKQGGSDGT